jgi:antitoxin (DNA-binding transcriptional repressor) of toxin-antitoxin stability system
VKAGAHELIVDRGRPVARLEPVTCSTEGEQNGRLSRLLQDGVIRPRRSDLPRALLDSQPPRARTGTSAVDALIKERRDSR